MELLVSKLRKVDLTNLRMPVYLMMSLMVMAKVKLYYFLTTLETESLITKMVQAFKSINPRWVDTKVVMSDKHFNECNLFNKEFPQATLQICLFHTLRSFKEK